MDDRLIVEQVRGATNIVSVVSEYVSLRRTGRNFMGICPFHGEKAPSFSVSEERQMFHCFGCKQGGDVFRFLMLAENMTFPEALRQLAEKAGVELPARSGARRGEPAGEKDRARKVHKLAQDFFHRQLLQTPAGGKALRYLEQRGLGREAAEGFGLGLAPPEWEGLVRHAAASGVTAAELERCGLAVRRRGEPGHYDLFRNRVTIPIRDLQGAVIAFGGRTVGDPGPREPKFLNSPETLLYRKGENLFGLDRAGRSIRERDAAVIVEGYFDLLQVASAGIANVVAPLGTSLTRGQVRLLARFTHNVVLSFDADMAGDEAARRSIHLFLEEGFDIRVLSLPLGEDPDDLIRKQGAEAYQRRMEAALPFFEHFLERSLARRDIRRPGEKLNVVNEVLPFLLSIKEKIRQREFVPVIAQRVRVEEELVLEKLREMSLQKQKGVRGAPATGGPAAGDGPLPAEKRLLSLILSSPRARERALEVLQGRLLEGLRCAGLFRGAADLAGRGEEVTFLRLFDSLPEEGEEREILSSLAAGREEAPPEEECLEETEGCLDALRRWVLQRELRQLQARLGEPAAGDPSRRRELLQEKSALLREITLLG